MFRISKCVFARNGGSVLSTRLSYSYIIESAVLVEPCSAGANPLGDISKHTHTHIQRRKHTYTHTGIHTYIHTHIHTYWRVPFTAVEHMSAGAGCSLVVG